MVSSVVLKRSLNATTIFASESLANPIEGEDACDVRLVRRPVESMIAAEVITGSRSVTLTPGSANKPANVIDCSDEAAADPDFLLTAAHVKAWEATHGPINPGEWVVMRTDWDKRAHDEELFLNEDPDPYEDGSHSPGPSTDCIDYLLGRGIVGWGTQCIGTDAGMAGKFSPPYPAHNFLHRDNCFGLASLCNLDQLPPKGAILIATPLKIQHGTGSPIRALALVPNGYRRGLPPRVRLDPGFG